MCELRGERAREKEQGGARMRGREREKQRDNTGEPGTDAVGRKRQKGGQIRTLEKKKKKEGSEGRTG